MSLHGEPAASDPAAQIQLEHDPLLYESAETLSDGGSIATASELSDPSNASEAAGSERIQIRYGMLFLVVALIAFVLQSEVVQFLQGPKSFYKPWFMLYIAHSSYIIFIPAQAVYWSLTNSKGLVSFASRIASLAQDLHDPARISDDSQLQQHETDAPFQMQISPCRAYAFLICRAALLTFLFTTASLVWYFSVSKIPMSDLTAIYNTSCFFTYLLSTIVLDERLQIRKAIAVGLSVMGIALISLFGSNAYAATRNSGSMQFAGYFSATLSSVFVALYEVMYTRLVVPTPPSALLSLHITGLIGLITLTCGLPVFPIMHWTGTETFEWPEGSAWIYIALIAALGVAFNALFMLVMTFAGPVLAAVGILATIPLTAAVDTVVTQKHLGWNTILGSIAIFVGFALMHHEQITERTMRLNAEMESESNQN